MSLMLKYNTLKTFDQIVDEVIEHDWPQPVDFEKTLEEDNSAKSCGML